MAASCPVCDQPAPSGLHCTTCGFPTALMDADPASATASAPSTFDEAEPMPPAELPARSPPRRDPETRVTSAIARSLTERVELLRTVDRNAPDATSEMCEAALSEASGRPSAALESLRSAQTRIERQTQEVLARRLADLWERSSSLERAGLRPGLEDDLTRLADRLLNEDVSSTIDALLELDQRLGRVESDWRGLLGLFAEIENLRREATALGVPLEGPPDPVAGIRERLSASGAGEGALDLAAQEAAQTLMYLHESIPTSVEAELARHAGTLGRLPDPHPPAERARKLHGDASNHLKTGRLGDALRAVAELRREIEALEKAPIAPPPAPVDVPPAIPPAPSSPSTPTAPVVAAAPALTREAPKAPAAPAAASGEEAVLGLLLKKARSLAVRVRSLPPESARAKEAAMRIREATELLRARQLAAADEALSRLMQILSSPTPGA